MKDLYRLCRIVLPICTFQTRLSSCLWSYKKSRCPTPTQVYLSLQVIASKTTNVTLMDTHYVITPCKFHYNRTNTVGSVGSLANFGKTTDASPWPHWLFNYTVHISTCVITITEVKHVVCCHFKSLCLRK